MVIELRHVGRLEGRAEVLAVPVDDDVEPVRIHHRHEQQDDLVADALGFVVSRTWPATRRAPACAARARPRSREARRRSRRSPCPLRASARACGVGRRRGRARASADVAVTFAVLEVGLARDERQDHAAGPSTLLPISSTTTRSEAASRARKYADDLLVRRELVVGAGPEAEDVGRLGHPARGAGGRCLGVGKVRQGQEQQQGGEEEGADAHWKEGTLSRANARVHENGGQARTPNPRFPVPWLFVLGLSASRDAPSGTAPSGSHAILPVNLPAAASVVPIESLP